VRDARPARPPPVPAVGSLFLHLAKSLLLSRSRVYGRSALPPCVSGISHGRELPGPWRPGLPKARRWRQTKVRRDFASA
jgi:hypothetical protein